jgi:carotenoid cleavage dioxygenase-like enzyme
LFKLNPDSPARYGVMSKYGKDVKWFEFPSHFIFHFINSWEEGDIIKIFGCINTPEECNRLDEFGEKFFQPTFEKIPKSNIVKIELNMKTGDKTYKVIDHEYAVDLP